MSAAMLTNHTGLRENNFNFNSIALLHMHRQRSLLHAIEAKIVIGLIGITEVAAFIILVHTRAQQVSFSVTLATRSTKKAMCSVERTKKLVCNTSKRSIHCTVCRINNC